MTKTLLEKKIESGFFGNMISAKKEIGSIVFYYQFFDAKKSFFEYAIEFCLFRGVPELYVKKVVERAWFDIDNWFDNEEHIDFNDKFNKCFRKLCQLTEIFL